MTSDCYAPLFGPDVCRDLLPPEKADAFFEALFGAAEDGSYDIELSYAGSSDAELSFNILLHERPGHCLACNLTQGLPQVFSRHPVIDVAGIVRKVGEKLAGTAKTGSWSLGHTQQRSRSLHTIPLIIELQPL